MHTMDQLLYKGHNAVGDESMHYQYSTFMS